MIKTVVIVEDDSGLREELETSLSKASDILCLYSVGSGEEAIRRISSQPPDVVLMDIQLPGMSGIECVSELKKRNPFLEIVILTVYEDADNIFRALRAGASGYLTKSNRPTNLLKAIRDVYGGAAPLSGSIARKVIRHFQVSKKAPEIAKLSPREKEILDLLAAGLFYKEIATDLNIGIETVRTHVKRICVKLHVRCRIEAIAVLHGERESIPL